MRTFYEILGISRNATQEEIIAAYRKRCLETHPDRGGDETAFLNVRKGYEILSNPNKRVEYDKWVKAKEDIENKEDISSIKKRLNPWINSFLNQYCNDNYLKALITTYYNSTDSIFKDIDKDRLNKYLTAEILKKILSNLRNGKIYKIEPILSLDTICNDILLGRKDISVSQDIGKKSNGKENIVKDKNKNTNNKLSNLVGLSILSLAGVLIYILCDTASNGSETGSPQYIERKQLIENESILKNSEDKDYISQLYDAIFSVYARFDNEDAFREWILIKENAESIYDLLEEEGYEYEGTKEDFLKRIGVNTAKDFNYANRDNNGLTNDLPKNSERNDFGKYADVGKVIRDANNAVDRALNRYKTSGNDIAAKVNNIGEESAYEETVFKTGDCPYSNYYGYGGGIGQFDKKSLSELRILNYSNSESVVLLETIQGVIIRNVYIKNNSEYTMTNIPEGKYRIKIMYGNSWNSEKDNGYGYPKGGFMKNVSFSKSKDNDLFDFIFEESYDGISYPTYSITLHKVRNGNMQTERISKDDFF